MAYQTNWEMFAGDARVLGITLTNDSGQAIPLGEITAITFCIKTSQTATTQLVAKSLGNGIAMTNQEAGEYEVTLDAVDTEDLGGAYYWESVVTDIVNGAYTAAYGFAVVQGKVVDRGAYCSLEEALALIADVQITKNTTPNIATARIIVETIARDIDGVLMGRGYTLPVTNTQALAFLKTTNQYGACAAIIKSKKPVDTGMGSDRGAFGYYQSVYQRNLTQLSDPKFLLFGDNSNSSSTGFSAGWTTTEFSEEHDDTNTPFWTRNMQY